jgi:hypothetical protein
MGQAVVAALGAKLYRHAAEAIVGWDAATPAVEPRTASMRAAQVSRPCAERR